jgi:hypothetical protein
MFFRALALWMIPVLLLLAIRKETSRNRTAKNAGDGKLVFELDQVTYWAWLALMVYLLYAIVIQFGGGPFRMSSVVVALVIAVFVVVLVAPFPEAITAGPEGLVQEVWFWLKKKKIPWGDVIEIRAGKKNRILTIVGANGTKVMHTRQLPDRDRLLEELYNHCRDKVPEDLWPMSVQMAEIVGAEAAGGPAAHPEAAADPMPAVDPAVEKLDGPAEA